MKKVLFALAFLILSISVNAQVYPRSSVGAFWVDSLFNSIYVDTLLAGGTDDDTTAARLTGDTLYTKLDFEWINFTIVDTTSAFSDSTISIVLEEIYPTAFTSGSRASATVTSWAWRKVNFARDSSWTNVSTFGIIATYTSYSAYIGACWGLRFRLANGVIVENYVNWIYATLSRKRF